MEITYKFDITANMEEMKKLVERAEAAGYDNEMQYLEELIKRGELRDED